MLKKFSNKDMHHLLHHSLNIFLEISISRCQSWCRTMVTRPTGTQWTRATCRSGWTVRSWWS